MYLMDSNYDFSLPGVQFRPRNQHPGWLVQEFARSGKAVMEVVFTRHEYCSAASCRSTFANAIARMKMPHILVRIRAGRVFLVNTLIAGPGRRTL